MKKTITIEVYVNGDFHRNTTVTATEDANFWDNIEKKLTERFATSSVGGEKAILNFRRKDQVLDISSKSTF